MDREKVIKQLENDAIATNTGYVEVPLWLFSEILALLKEQEAKTPIPHHRSDGTIFKYECRTCRAKIFKNDAFCRRCGNPQIWT